MPSPRDIIAPWRAGALSHIEAETGMYGLEADRFLDALLGEVERAGFQVVGSVTPPTWRNDPEFQAVFHDPVRDTTMPVATAAVAAYKRTAIAELEANFSDYVWLPQVRAVLEDSPTKGATMSENYLPDVRECDHPRIAEGWGGPPKCLNCGAVWEDSP